MLAPNGLTEPLKSSIKCVMIVDDVLMQWQKDFETLNYQCYYFWL